MRSQLPTCLDIYHFNRKISDRHYALTEEDKKFLKIIIHMVTGEIDEIQFREDGSIWARPAVRSKGAILNHGDQLLGMGDHTEDYRLVRDEEFYRLALHPELSLSSKIYRCLQSTSGAKIRYC